MPTFNPVREITMAGSLMPGVTGLTGAWVDTSNIVGPVSFIVMAGPGLAAANTITFECIGEDPANQCLPAAGAGTAIVDGDFCSGVAATAMTIVMDPAHPDYVSAGQRTCFRAAPCPCRFVRAKSSAAGPISVMVAGKAARLAQA
jgi:hypothetical protein